MADIWVVKYKEAGKETWRYPVHLINRSDQCIQVEGFFDRDQVRLDDITLQRGDRFVEYYYSDRWYNVYEIFDRSDGILKGWYCNITYPAVIETDKISYIDLALDLLVYPNGRKVILDEDEFSRLNLSEIDRVKARTALLEVIELFRTIPPKL